MPERRTTPDGYKRARQLRRAQTEPEARLWSRLRAHRLEGVGFRRQHAIGPFIVDFCAPRQKLVIELDGSQHLDRENYDASRTRYLDERGYRVVRFFNDQVMNHLESVLEVIRQALDQ